MFKFIDSISSLDTLSPVGIIVLIAIIGITLVGVVISFNKK